MNLENIKKEMIVKNYKEMCSLLGEEVKAGNSKKSQIKEWECYFSFHKEGNKFVIDEVYKDPKINLGNYKNSSIIKNINKGVYSKEMFPLVKNFVGKSDLEFHSKSYIMTELKLKNMNYEIAFQHPEKVSNFISKEYNMDISKDDINTILSSMWAISQDKINNSFKNLEKLDYICCYENKLLCIWNSDSNKHEVVLGEEHREMTKIIYDSKMKALANFFSRSKTKSMDDYVELMNTIKSECDDIETDDITEVLSSKLNIELYLRGLGTEARNIAINTFKQGRFKYVDSFYYGYGYIKNSDIEWDKEILEIAKEKMYINNFKEAVKSQYIMETFMDRWFKNEDKKIHKLTTTDSRKRKFRTELSEHKKEYQEKLSLLCDIFVVDKPIITIKIENINNNSKLNEDLPF